jgi:hypothetical protein
LSKAIAIVLGTLYLLGALFGSAKDYLALVPGYTIPPHFYVWNIFTAGFFELSIFNVRDYRYSIYYEIGVHYKPKIKGETEFTLKLYYIGDCYTYYNDDIQK